MWGKLQHHHSAAPHPLTKAVVAVGAAAVAVVTDTVAGGLA